MLKALLLAGLVASLGAPALAVTKPAKSEAITAPAAKAEPAPAVTKDAAPVKPSTTTTDKAEASVPFQGEWAGQFIGDTLGTIKVTVTEDGLAKVFCVVDSSKREFDLTGPVEASGSVSAVEKSFGPSGIKVHFTGKLTHKGTASGTWENKFFGLKGTWSATRVAVQ